MSDPLGTIISSLKGVLSGLSAGVFHVQLGDDELNTWEYMFRPLAFITVGFLLQVILMFYFAYRSAFGLPL